MSQNQPNSRIPDPRQYWQSSTGPGYFYRHPDVGTINQDGTFVPPQTAPTSPELLAVYLAQNLSVAPTGSAANPAVPAPTSRGQWSAHIAQIGPSGPSRAGRARGGFQFQPRGGIYLGEQNTHRGSYSRGPSRGGGNRGGQSSRAARQFNPVSFGAQNPRAPGSYAPSALSQVATIYTAPPVSPAAPFVAIPPPDVNVAVRSPRGHPLFPYDNPADAPMEDVVGVVPGAQERANAWHRSETARIEEWGRKLGRGNELPRDPLPADPASVGAWMGALICSSAQAYNLMCWSDAGCTQAWAMVQFIQQSYALRPLAYRPVGVGLILSSQAVSLERYTRATMGSAHLSKRAARRAAAATRAISASGSQVVDTNVNNSGFTISAPVVAEEAAPVVASATEEDIEMGAIAAYLGTSPAGDDAGDFNSRVSVEEADAYWSSMATSLWPKALRNAKGELPTVMNDVPFTNDSRVLFTLRIFGPTTGISLAEFTAKSMSMFSCAGMFDEFCVVSGYPSLSRGPEHYNFETTVLDWSLMASWWCTHGISPGSPAVLAFESYARSHRNQLEGHADPENDQFLTYPNSPLCVKTIPGSHIIRWQRISHGELCASLRSSYPRRPSELVPEDDIMDGVPKEDRVDWSLETDRPNFNFGNLSA
ncbi:hypothetical protein C8F04DRAFT_1272549 [Mycena alexandri]|uniref:Uncharacterized protein n=1 Tax=Mycena alexandri TaxID=1745969 RepID=A0AAD6WPS2_9AGAR|nr:hypothetical protein C8F04DRAFT_1272549 [Mycena alexandri]